MGLGWARCSIVGVHTLLHDRQSDASGPGWFVCSPHSKSPVGPTVPNSHIHGVCLARTIALFACFNLNFTGSRAVISLTLLVFVGAVLGAGAQGPEAVLALVQGPALGSGLVQSLWTHAQVAAVPARASSLPAPCCCPSHPRRTLV